MKLSDGVEWGMHCATLLAGLPEGAVLAGKDLAEFHGVSESYLLKHLKAMTKAGLLDSVPGPQGGFRLARPATEITFLDVVEAIEGPVSIFRCTEIRQRGPLPPSPGSLFRRPCAINAGMRKAERAYRDALRQQTLAELFEHLATTLPPDRQQAALTWLAPRVRYPGKGSPKGDEK